MPKIIYQSELLQSLLACQFQRNYCFNVNSESICHVKCVRHELSSIFFVILVQHKISSLMFAHIPTKKKQKSERREFDGHVMESTDDDDATTLTSDSVYYSFTDNC